MTASEPFDLTTTYVHLGLGARTIPLPDFEWSGEYLAKYGAEHGADGDEGRLVFLGANQDSWTSWERHPAGEELVVLLSGRMTLIQEIDGVAHRVEMRAGHAAINPRNAWHTADIHEPGQVLFITPGRGTDHRPR